MVPIEIERSCLEKRRAHKLFRRRTFDDRNRGCSHTKKIDIGIFDFDANRKALRDAHPVEFAFDVRNSRWRQIELALRLHRPTNPLYFSTEALVRRGREINNRFAAGSHVSNFGLAKICNDVPFARVEQREDGDSGANMGAGVPVFSLLDTSKWYVIANFREAEVRHMAPGSEAIVYLSSAPNQRFRGK